MLFCVHTKLEKSPILYVHFHLKRPLKAFAHIYFPEKVRFRMYISRWTGQKMPKCTDKFIENADFVCTPAQTVVPHTHTARRQQNGIAAATPA